VAKKDSRLSKLTFLGYSVISRYSGESFWQHFLIGWPVFALEIKNYSFS